MANSPEIWSRAWHQMSFIKHKLRIFFWIIWYCSKKAKNKLLKHFDKFSWFHFTVNYREPRLFTVKWLRYSRWIAPFNGYSPTFLHITPVRHSNEDFFLGTTLLRVAIKEIPPKQNWFYSFGTNAIRNELH